MTREETLRRFKAAKARKQEHAKELVEFLKKDYKARTGLDAVSYEIW